MLALGRWNLTRTKLLSKSCPKFGVQIAWTPNFRQSRK